MKLRSRVPEFFHNARSRISSVFATDWTQVVQSGWIWVVILPLIICVPVGALVLAMRLGHETQFPSSDPHTGFHPNPDTRGTISIISMCLLTIFPCVYVVVHPDIGQAQANHAFITLFAPESVIAIALGEFLLARRGRLWMRSRGFPQWTITHAFAAHMGCFAIEDGEGALVIYLNSETFYDWICRNVNPATHTFDYEGILRELKDRSKHNSLAKALIVFQALRIAVQAIARAAQSLPVTELELTTCAYVVCTLATYVVWWHKPYCIHEHVALKLKSATHGQDQKPDPDSEVIGKGGGTEEQLLLPANHHSSSGFAFDSRLTKTEHILVGLGGACSALIIGAIHALAWNAVFINSHCQVLWHICCLVHFICPTVVVLASISLSARESDVVRNICIAIGFFNILLYVLSRVLLFLLIGLSFWSQPVNAYVELKWLSFIPQWS